ncbi:4-hydroxy-3-methylbut-2-enyl diphosphate reductase [bacterium endosymbiont of Pedicinus badii]|uniref:4-hydroxy-3-methylbut-2-enyl diphosphate reductase n=1 Tax=bacterium endosymbiont of Pedicinus badii TaxID=1719126 RepID=UPI0009BB8DCA|nr:4-hydroxy-3-methylbut-2-enyl diphosphate reductase [bacterium endosymbiont of Pedicinus badii]OQM34203.1 hypothetical protein AOQ89_02625 [bacterium endosymbiont of Pedicinus badii]
MKRKIFLLNPRGFCAGVKRAIYILENLVKIYKNRIYVYQEIVHNKYLIDKFKKLGVIFENNINKIPENSILVFPAHGVSKKIEDIAKKKNFLVFDATCPLVKKVHFGIRKANLEKRKIIIIGNENHAEIQGSIGQYDKKENIYIISKSKQVKNIDISPIEKLSFFTQTTLSFEKTKKIVEKLKKKFPNLSGQKKDDICYATYNRQMAIKSIFSKLDLLIVVGSKNSSNANKLVESFKILSKKKSFLVENFSEIKKEWFIKKVNNIGITSGASTPENLVQKVVSYLKGWNIKVFEEQKTNTKELQKFRISKKFFKKE